MYDIHRRKTIYIIYYYTCSCAPKYFVPPRPGRAVPIIWGTFNRSCGGHLHPVGGAAQPNGLAVGCCQLVAAFKPAPMAPAGLVAWGGRTGTCRGRGGVVLEAVCLLVEAGPVLVEAGSVLVEAGDSTW